MKDLSIILPSKRHFHLKRTLFEIHENTTGVDYEVIVISPFRVEGDHTIWVPEPPGGCGGPGPANSLGYAYSSGRYICPMTDDVLPIPNWATNAMHFVEENEKECFPFCAGLVYLRSPIPGNHNISFGSAYGHYFPFFPFMSRRSVEAIGGWILPEFRRGFTDADLGLRVWHNGGVCRQCTNSCVLSAQLAILFSNALDIERDFSDQMDDFARFVEKWKPVYGEGWPDDFHVIAQNHDGLGDLVDGTYVNTVPPANRK